MKEEYLDIYDETGNLIGKAPRTEVHSKGYWHRTFHCWVINRRNNNIVILFQKRQATKDTYPNLYDISSAGHLSAGEHIKHGVRELEEELGIKAELKDLYDLGMSSEVLIEKSFIDREYHHVFLYITDRSLKDFTIQLKEISGLVYLELEDVCKLFKNEVFEIMGESLQADLKGDRQYSEINLCKRDFVPHGDEYYLKVFNAAMEYLKNK
jgi:isopentenyldiphosphate isomerase